MNNLYYYLVSCRMGWERRLVSMIRNEFNQRTSESSENIINAIIFGDNKKIFFNKYFAINSPNPLNYETLRKILNIKNIFKISPVSEEKIKNFNNFLISNEEKNKDDGKIKKGSVVKICDEKNPFFGYEGIIENIKEEYFVIEIDFFERKVSLKISKEKVIIVYD